jgi:aryl-alcohol dehydrogenase-like predicted oxidoreductase
MKYRQLGKSDLKVSIVGIGTWAMGDDYWGPVDDAESISAIREAVDNGINLIDTAPAYGGGHSEDVVGRAVEGRRSEVILATKVGTLKTPDGYRKDLSPAVIVKQLEDSLRYLKTDVIDLYQIHWPDPDTPLEESLEALDKLKSQGKFRYLGVSNFDIPLLEEAVELTEIVSLQPQYSLLKREIEADLLPFCKENNIGTLGYGSLAGGILTGKFDEIPELPEGDNRKNFYPFFQEPEWSRVQKVVDVLKSIGRERSVPTPQVAINWANRDAGVTCSLVGAKRPDQAKTNAESADWELSAEEIDRIEAAYLKFMPA